MSPALQGLYSHLALIKVFTLRRFESFLVWQLDRVFSAIDVLIHGNKHRPCVADEFFNVFLQSLIDDKMSHYFFQRFTSTLQCLIMQF